MAAQIITLEDLELFKQNLLEDLRKMFSENETSSLKQYLKSPEVMKLLQISPGTLQNLRIRGTLPYTKVGGVIYYDQADLKKMLAKNKSEAQTPNSEARARLFDDLKPTTTQRKLKFN